jgi:hypothetical protein
MENENLSPDHSPVPPNEKPGVKVKIIIGLIASLVVLLAGIWLLFFKIKITELSLFTKSGKNVVDNVEKIEPTIENWKTLTGEIAGYKYELKYPPEWQKEDILSVKSPDDKAGLSIGPISCWDLIVGESTDYKFESHGTTTRAFRTACIGGAQVGAQAFAKTVEETLEYRKTLDQILRTIRLAKDTSSWKVYRSSEYFFELKYPDGYRFVNVFDNPYGSPDLELEKYDEQTGMWEKVNFYVSAEKSSSIESEKMNAESWRETSLLGRSAVLFVEMVCEKKVVFMNDGIKYTVTEPTSCNLERDSNVVAIFESFKIFGSDGSGSETLSGNLYSSKAKGVEFRYPSDWTLHEGPTTAQTVLKPNMVLARNNNPKNSPTKYECTIEDQKSNEGCEVIEFQDKYKAYLYWDPGAKFMPGGRYLGNAGTLKTHFEDHLYFRNKKGEEVEIFLLSILKEDALRMLVKSILSSVKFID